MFETIPTIHLKAFSKNYEKVSKEWCERMKSLPESEQRKILKKVEEYQRHPDIIEQ